MGVVPCTLLGIGENLVGRLNFGKKPRGLLDVSVVAIRVQFEGLPSICLFDPVEG